jgi:predicted polyphosphate/ATP-dependent NAD kinase
MSFKPVGIIANPASGKDIRRLVSHGSVFNDMEKANIIKRILVSLDALNVPTVYLMPDHGGLTTRAVEDVEIGMTVRTLDMEIRGNQDDSTRAAGLMNELGVACIITLGGDGTNRVVVKACGQTPVLPVSTGTNNVFPFLVEGTMAGIAAGVMAAGVFPIAETCFQAPILEVYRQEKLLDIALIDLVVTDHAFVGAKAVWEVDAIKEVFLTQARPTNIGFSALGGYLMPLARDSKKGLHISLGRGELSVKVPIAPGLIREMPIKGYTVFGPQDELVISRSPAILALDGEREVGIKKGEQMTLRLNTEGPFVVDIESVLEKSSQKGFFLTKNSKN